MDWSPFLGKKWTDAGDTAIPLTEWKRLAEKLTTIPDSFTPHQRQVKKVYDRPMMPWAAAKSTWTGAWRETMAFASLVSQRLPSAPVRPGFGPWHVLRTAMP